VRPWEGKEMTEGSFDVNVKVDVARDVLKNNSLTYCVYIRTSTRIFVI